MASNVWVRVSGRNGKYIRGSEIIEVFTQTSRIESYGKEYQRGLVKITQARTDTAAGTSPESLTLWEFETRPPAHRAARMLLAALSRDSPAVVYLDEDEQVRSDSLPIEAF